MSISTFAKQAMVCICMAAMAACSNTKNIQSTTKVALPLTTAGPVWAALWTQKAAEYKALCFQAYNLATLRLDAYTTMQHDKPFAVITDIDETVLDNSPYDVHQGLKGLDYTDSSWMEWTAKVECDTVPGALAFLKYASSKNVEVFYITNRLQAEENQTLENLKKYNFPNADAGHLLLKTKISGKDARRSTVAERYNILLFLGDNLGDFSGIYDHQSTEKRAELVKANAADFGSRFIVLPNIMYGEWLGAWLNYQYQKSLPEQNEILQKQVRDYK